jgi:hypothetical protein
LKLASAALIATAFLFGMRTLLRWVVRRLLVPSAIAALVTVDVLFVFLGQQGTAARSIR